MNKKYMFPLAGAIAFVVYNVVLFVLAGFEDHTSTFWISYVFTLVGFAALAVTGLLLAKTGQGLKDWLFSYPIVKYSVGYTIAQAVVSIIFMLLESELEWKVPFVIQLIFLAVYVILIISCFYSRQVIKDVQKEVKVKTATAKFIRVEADMAVAECTDPETRKILAQFAEKVRYSDPVSVPGIKEFDEQLTAYVNAIRTNLRTENFEQAAAICAKADILLAERNAKLKMLK